MLRRTRSRLRAAHYFLFFYARQKRKSDFERLLKKVFFFFFSPVGLFSWYSCALTRYFADVFFSGITANKSENEISLFSLLEKLTIKFSSLRRLVLTFDFCKRKASLHKFLRRIFDKSHPLHTKKTETKFSLSSLSLCFHDNRTTSYTL